MRAVRAQPHIGRRPSPLHIGRRPSPPHQVAVRDTSSTSVTAPEGRPAAGSSQSRQGHAAAVWGGVEPGPHVGVAELVEQGGDEVQVHAAHQRGVLAGQRVERAVRQHDPVALDPWFVPVRGERGARRGRSRSGARLPSRALRGAEPVPGLGRRALHRLENGRAVADGVLDGAGQDLPGQVVVRARAA